MTAAAIAADQFRTRQQVASRRVATGQWSRAEAEAKLRPWLAIACGAGSELPELMVEEYRVYPDPGTIVMRRMYPDELATRSDWTAELAAARNASMDRLSVAGDDATPAQQDTAIALCILADHLGVPSYLPARQLVAA